MPRSPDILVIGGGIVGCAVAHELARRGASVQVIEERAVGRGATHAAAGILAPHIEISSPGAFLDFAIRSLDAYDDFIARVQSDSGRPVLYRRSGTLQVAVNHETMQDLRGAAERLEARGLQLSLLNAQGARTEEPRLGADVMGGLVVHAHGFVAAGELVDALAAAARRYGARFIEGCRVRRIASSGDDVVVETDGGSLSASAAVLAAGSWSPHIEIAGVAVRPPVCPIRGQLVRLRTSTRILERVVWSDRCYLVPWDDGTVLVGATMEDAGFDERTTVAGVRDLIEAACELVPTMWAAAFLDARAGLRPASSDHRPIIGASTVLSNLMYATGHFRNGILLAPLTAALVADAMLDGRVDPALDATKPQRFGEL